MIKIPSYIAANVSLGFYQRIVRDILKEAFAKNPDLPDEEADKLIDVNDEKIKDEIVKLTTKYYIAEGFYDSDAELTLFPQF